MSETINDKNTQPEKQNETPVKKKRPLWQKIVAGVVLLFVVMVIFVNMATSGAVKISNQFIDDIQAKKANDAYSLFSSEAAKVVPKDEFTTVVNQIGPILNTTEKMKSKEVIGETGKAATAKVVYEIKGTDGVTYEITVNLVKEDDQWKVVNFDSNQ